MIYPVFEATAKGGKLRLKDREKFDGYAEGLRPGKYLIVVVEESQRTTWDQHKYYRSVVLQTIADHIGRSPELLHEDLCENFYRKGRGNCTSKMSRAQMSAHIDRCTSWAYDFLGVVVPLPHQVIDIGPEEVG